MGSCRLARNGTLDQRLGHKRRYSAESARRLLETQGFQVEGARSFNKVALLPWWAYSREAEALVFLT